MSEISKIDQNLILKRIDNKTLNIQIADNEMLMSIVGQFDQNIKNLAKLSKTNIFLGETLLLAKVREKNINIFSEAIKFLANKYLLTKIIEKEDIILSVKKILNLKSQTLSHLNN